MRDKLKDAVYTRRRVVDIFFDGDDAGQTAARYSKRDELSK